MSVRFNGTPVEMDTAYAPMSVRVIAKGWGISHDFSGALNLEKLQQIWNKVQVQCLPVLIKMGSEAYNQLEALQAVDKHR